MEGKCAATRVILAAARGFLMGMPELADAYADACVELLG